MKKIISLAFLMMVIFPSMIFAQQTNDLRGARIYYSLPFYGVFGPNTNHFKPNQIDEVNDQYILSGWFNYGFTDVATTVSLNKYSNSISWDYNGPVPSETSFHTILPNNQILVSYTSNQTNTPDDSLSTVLFNLDGSYSKKKFKTDSSVFYIESVNHLEQNKNFASGNQDDGVPGGVWPIVWPLVIQIDDEGNVTDSIQLPITNTYNNLPVYMGEAFETFNYKEDFLTFGNFWRSPGDAYPNLVGRCPVLWHWNSDSVFITREVYEGFSGNSNVISSDKLTEMDGDGNEFIISVFRREEVDTIDLSSPTYNYLTFLDSNLNVVWDKKLGTFPRPYWYTLEDLKYDAENGVIYACGFVESETDPWYRSLFLAKYRRNGTQIYIKHFIINEFRNTSINCMNILDDGDLIFTGRGRDSLSNAFFFTYRTGPDGYHEDGAYLGLEEVLASETDIGIFPNPSDGIFQVSSISTEPMKITMHDQQGKQVAQFELDELSSNNSFDLSDQAPGVYFAHVSQGEQQWVKKLVVR
jgi:hypothetical protein